MDIVSRLKKFISFANVPVTQFADNCNIARPTLSQLLNGRNKKVSDELISKIHDAYPTLSVLWLMFGEGDMLTEKNIEISQPKTASIFDYDTTETPKDEEVTTSISFEKNLTQKESDIFSTGSDLIEADNSLRINDSDSKKQTADQTAPNSQNSITFSTDQKKKIVNIIVYYNDNSFESFIPNPNK